MSQPIIIRKIALATIKDRKLLLTREAANKNAFFMLGGRVKPGEAEEVTLNREVAEEVGCSIKKDSLRFLHEFEAPAFGRENTLVNIRLYLGELDGEPKPSNEIEEIRYFNSSIEKRHLTTISEEIIQWLKANNYID